MGYVYHEASRLNYTMVLYIYKEMLDNLELDSIANEFVQGSEHRLTALENSYNNYR